MAPSNIGNLGDGGSVCALCASAVAAPGPQLPILSLPRTPPALPLRLTCILLAHSAWDGYACGASCRRRRVALRPGPGDVPGPSNARASHGGLWSSRYLGPAPAGYTETVVETCSEWCASARAWYALDAIQPASDRLGFSVCVQVVLLFLTAVTNVPHPVAAEDWIPHPIASTSTPGICTAAIGDVDVVSWDGVKEYPGPWSRDGHAVNTY